MRAQFRDTVLLSWPNGALGVPPSSAGASVALYDVGTSSPITDTIYADSTSALTLPNPMPPGSDGLVDFWLPEERELDLVVSASGYSTVRTTVTTDAAGAAGLSMPFSETLTFAPDNTYDIGADGASRPHNLFMGSSILWGSSPNQAYINGDPSGSLELSAAGSNSILLDSPTTIFGDLSLNGALSLGGGLTWGVDNTYDIGASGANRPRNIYAAGGVVAQSLQSLGNTIYLGTTNALWGGAGVPSSGMGGNGDFYFRTDGAAGTSIYQKRAGTWTATAA